MRCLRRRGAFRHTRVVGTRLVDCRPAAAYRAAHLPGAVHADPERDLTGTDGGGRHPLPIPEAFAAWASRVGIDAATTVVAYDEGDGWAARLWWLLRHFGHDAAGTIPLAAWRGPLSSEDVHVEPSTFVAKPRVDDVATADELSERRGDPRLVLVDARAPERWRGEVEPIDAVAGRIPGARNLFFEQADPVPPELLEAEELVVYCGSGVTACVDLLALSLAGRSDARLYPGSWSDWSSRGLPVERD
jgi:thiosulfate/3-mercaptopyruvate sulfurtransferase